ncbi:MAG TPA: DNA polymerase III subunit delta', partial [Flavobacterium sp.]|nr:DNA polymerase III subunit delta' [Flavobacterium sp.]
IRVADADLFTKALALKSYEGGYKVMIIAMADRMNVEVANKILKALEEPTPRTLIILTCEDIYDLLPTVRSRCQIVHFNKLAHPERNCRSAP